MPVTSFNISCSSYMQARKPRSEEHTSELQSRVDLVCRLLLEKKKKKQKKKNEPKNINQRGPDSDQGAATRTEHIEYTRTRDLECKDVVICIKRHHEQVILRA